jgi:hypothetical protein
MDLPPDMTPKAFDAMVARHTRQLGEHSLAVVVITIRQEDSGASGVYFRTSGNSHAAEKAAEDFVTRARVRRETRFRLDAERELASEPPSSPPPEAGEEWKG